MQKVFVRVVAAVLCLMCLYQGWQILLYSPPSSKNPAQDIIRHDSPTVNAQAGSSYLNGHLEYYNQQNRNYTSLAFASVEVHNESGGGEFLGRCYTDMNGNFTFGPIDSSPNGINVSCNVYTMTDAVTLYNGDPSPSVYSYTIPDILIPAGQNKSMSDQYYDVSGGFTVFSYDTGLNRGWYYIFNTTGRDITGAKAYYPVDDPNAPCYYNATRKIVFPIGTYHYTDTILHEYAHYVMHCLYGLNYWPSGYIDYDVDKASNNITAWIEGWAFYFPLAVDNNGTYYGSGGNLWDFENKNWNTSGWDDGDDVVGRVAGVFWDIYDSHNDTGQWSYENLTDGFCRTWNTMCVACSADSSAFRMFWTIWNGTYYVHNSTTHQKDPTSPYGQLDWNHTLLAMFQNSIDYRGAGDVNVDGTCDIKDQALVNRHYGQYEGQLGWDYLYDLNHDGTIDIKDLAITGRNYGKSYDC